MAFGRIGSGARRLVSAEMLNRSFWSRNRAAAFGSDSCRSCVTAECLSVGHGLNRYRGSRLRIGSGIHFEIADLFPMLRTEAIRLDF